MRKKSIVSIRKTLSTGLNQSINQRQDKNADLMQRKLTIFLIKGGGYREDVQSAYFSKLGEIVLISNKSI